MLQAGLYPARVSHKHSTSQQALPGKTPHADPANLIYEYDSAHDAHSVWQFPQKSASSFPPFKFLLYTFITTIVSALYLSGIFLKINLKLFCLLQDIRPGNTSSARVHTS